MLYLLMNIIGGRGRDFQEAGFRFWRILAKPVKKRRACFHRLAGSAGVRGTQPPRRHPPRPTACLGDADMAGEASGQREAGKAENSAGSHAGVGGDGSGIGAAVLFGIHGHHGIIGSPGSAVVEIRICVR